MFKRPADNRILAIGPKWRNLKKHLLLLEVYLGERRIKFELFHTKAICEFRTEPVGSLIDSTLELEFRFLIYSYRVEIVRFHLNSLPGSVREARLTTTTLQMDNHVAWVEDWNLWHHRLYGVERLILYDNGSSNLQNLVDRLGSFDVEITTIYVNWLLKIGRKPDYFVQRNSLNHCRLLYGVPGNYCMNFDIDEYVVYSTEEQLIE